MLYIPFKYNNNKFYISLLVNNPNYNDKLEFNKKINKIHHKCFETNTDYDDLIGFTKYDGINFVIYDKNHNPIFLVTFIKNYMTNNIEIFNVCKKLNNKIIDSSGIINHLILYFVKDCDLFKNCEKIILAIQLDNKFIVPTIFCYQNIGFTYIKNGNIPMVSGLPPHFNMELELGNFTPLNKQQKIDDFMLILKNHFNTRLKLIDIYNKLTKCKQEKLSKKQIKKQIIIYLDSNL